MHSLLLIFIVQLVSAL